MKASAGASILILVLAASTVSRAAVTQNTTHGVDGESLNEMIWVNDILSFLVPTELPGDAGWHPANTNPADQLPVFTDDAGGSGLAGLLADFQFEMPVKRIQYDLPEPTDIERIQILTGNDGKDGRVFSTTRILVSVNGGASFSEIGYFESDLLGTVNSGQWGSTVVEVFDDAGGLLADGATDLIFEFYSVDNYQGVYRDPFDGVNPFTNFDDGLTAAVASPLVWEIDAVAGPPSMNLNVDFGAEAGLPSDALGGAAGQPGVWNRGRLGTTLLDEVDGRPNVATVQVSAQDDTGVWGTASTDTERVLEDYFQSLDASWTVGLTGLLAGRYRLYLYPPSHTSVSMGDVDVGGTLIPSIPGDPFSALTEGVSWTSVDVVVPAGTLQLTGSCTGYCGLAGLQLTYLPEPSLAKALTSGLLLLMVLSRARRMVAETSPRSVGVG